jgi:hypothetical protein
LQPLSKSRTPFLNLERLSYPQSKHKIKEWSVLVSPTMARLSPLSPTCFQVLSPFILSNFLKLFLIPCLFYPYLLGYMGYVPQYKYKFGNTYAEQTHKLFLDPCVNMSPRAVLTDICPDDCSQVIFASGHQNAFCFFIQNDFLYYYLGRISAKCNRFQVWPMWMQ